MLPAEPPAAFLPTPGRGAWPVLFDYLRRATDPATPAAVLPHLLSLARAEAGPVLPAAAPGMDPERMPLDRVLDLEPGRLGAALLVMALAPESAVSQALDAAFGPANASITALKRLRPELAAGLSRAPAFIAALDRRAALWLAEDTLAESVLGAASLQPRQAAELLARLPARAAECLAAALLSRYNGASIDVLARSIVLPAGGEDVERPPLVAALVVLGRALLAAEQEPPGDGGIETLAEAWQASPLPCMESRLSALAEELAGRASALVPRLRPLVERMRLAVRARIEAWDQHLAVLLGEPGALAAYHGSPRALPAAQRELRPRHLPEGAAIFLIVLDGMRLDTWRDTVRPLLERDFQVVREEQRFATLPTYTVISRTAFFAGAQPDGWQGGSGERELAATALGLNAGRRAEEFLYETQASEHLEGAAPPDRRRFNALVYNVCDDEVHGGGGGTLAALQRRIRSRLQDEVLPDLRLRVREGDVLIVTSDHGFYQLEPGDAVDTPSGSEETANDVVKYRLIERPPTNDGLVVDWGRAGRFRLAIGKQWFRRSGGSHTPFSHGGLSLHEALVPAAVLRLATQGVWKLTLTRVSEATEAVEGEPVTLAFSLRNTGNRPVTARLEAQGTEFTVAPATVTLPPAEQREVEVNAPDGLRVGSYGVTLVARYRARPDDEVEQLERAVAPVHVNADAGRVEFSRALDIFGDLDER